MTNQERQIDSSSTVRRAIDCCQPPWPPSSTGLLQSLFMTTQPSFPATSTGGSCPHLASFITPLGIRRLSLAAEFLFSSIYRPCIGAAPSLVPRCMHGTTCPRPTTNEVCVCIQCVYIVCRQHLRAGCGHKVFLSAEYGRLFCAACQDFVHDAFLDAAIDLQRQVAMSAKRAFVGSESWIDVPKLDDGISFSIGKRGRGRGRGRGRKRGVVRNRGKKRRAIMASSWIPTEKEYSNIQSQCMGHIHRLAARTKPVGLFNLGNSCYMNSVLQAFLNAPPLRCFFLADGHRPSCTHEPKSDCLACAFDELVCDSITEELNLEDHNNSNNMLAMEKDKKSEKKQRRWFLIPQRALDIVWRYADNLASYAQHDAHEFLITALNILNAHMRVGVARGSGASDGREVPLSPVCNARIGPRSAGLPSHPSKQSSPSIVQSFFSGILQSDVICRVCGNSSSTQEKFYDISLDVDKFTKPVVTEQKSRGPSPASTLAADLNLGGQTTDADVTMTGQSSDQPTSASRSPTPATTDTGSADASPANSVADCLTRFTEPEMLGSGSKLFCPVCKSSQEAMKQMSIRTLPPVLCLHFKRFEQTFAKIRRSEMVKIENAVEFPIDSLDLSPFSTSAVLHKRLKLDQNSDKNTVNAILAAQGLPDEVLENRPHLSESKVRTNEDGLYDLFAVVNHSGKIDRGHYTTLIRRRGHWFKCDDEKVTHTKKVGNSIRSEHAYLLFYVQRTPYFQY